MTYELATGADPAGFATDLQNHFVFWRWVLIFHILSWLVVPVLTGTAVSAAFHAWEERKLDLHDRLLEKMKKALLTGTKLTPEAARELARLSQEEMSKKAKGAGN